MYQFDMMLEEIRVLSKLEDRDTETFNERSHFFTKEVVVEVAEDYLKKLRKHIDKLPVKKCKGVPYKRVGSMNIFVVDLDKKVFNVLLRHINHMGYASNYNELYRRLRAFMNVMIKLPHNTPKSKVWIDAFKGEGAYYTLKNLVMFHGCGINIDKTHTLYGTSAIRFLNEKLDEYKGAGWRMFALMKKVIEDNNFDFQRRMQEIYSK